MRYAFGALTALAVVFAITDYREIAAAASAMQPVALPGETDGLPLLAPALTEGEPQAMPGELTSERTTLRQPIAFSLRPGGVLLARGTMDIGASGRFAAEIADRGEYVKTVALDSPGGSVEDALAIAALVREKAYATRVPAGHLCASSCPIVLAGGVGRSAEEGAVVGVHQVFGAGAARPSAEQAMSDAQRTTARVTRHLKDMGVDPALWLHALDTPPDRLYYLSPEEMRHYGLVTAEAVAAAQ
ncbi:ATP-dependent Clp protease proteolytic subunit [Rhizobium sp. TRM95111]|uniref:ATP-dependent Clp protease proteolytic subunit n=1 Tax=Rhizobium alarense TaxID=2846851 RepID=UPI001F17D484|nr:ATP-dependent Clp protease proteolytic subunit [Rhizobium alarense]MCF3642811.1 ATP-dependent Clp protease proteolytic subunit [Rhizobium alarense]